MFRTLCFEYRVITIDYFFNELEEWEASEILKQVEYLDRYDKEINRYKLFLTAQVNSKKKLKPTDIVSLPWDKKTNSKEIEFTDEDKKRMEQRIEKYKKMLNNE